MKEDKEYNFIIWLCEQYKKEETDVHEHDFYTIGKFIQECENIEQLKSLENIIPLGMLKYRLIQKIRNS